MKCHPRFLAPVLHLALTGCAAEEAPPVQPGQEIVAEEGVDAETGLPTNPSTVRLPASVKIVSDTNRNFGIDVSRLSPEHASIVTSAWESYSRVLAGGEPRCPMAYAASDGGTTIHFCDGFNLTRVHGMSSQGKTDGYEYGPMLDLLNGQRVERLKFYSEEQLAALKKSAP